MQNGVFDQQFLFLLTLKILPQYIENKVFMYFHLLGILEAILIRVVVTEDNSINCNNLPGGGDTIMFWEHALYAIIYI